jgi:putative transposase
MPRHSRLVIPDVPLHIWQRAVDRRACFGGIHDYELYLGLVSELSRKFDCRVHAYVLMTNHVHLVLSSPDTQGYSLFMKDLAQRYATKFNRSNARGGPLWEGRFRSSPLDTVEYLLICHRYVELNPVRAGMVNSPDEYPWSSHLSNAFGQPSLFLRPHAEYLKLGQRPEERQMAYRALFKRDLTRDELTAIRDSVRANAALGRPEFVEEMARRSGREARLIPRGRPIGADGEEAGRPF